MQAIHHTILGQASVPTAIEEIPDEPLALEVHEVSDAEVLSAEEEEGESGRGRQSNLEAMPWLREHGLFFSDALLNMPAPTKEQDEAAKKKFGKDFPFLRSVRSGTAAERIEARNYLIERHMGLVWKFCSLHPWYEVIRSRRWDVALESVDLWQNGSIAIHHALETFDYTRGTAFSTHAWQWIRQHTQRELENAGLIRVPVHAWAMIWMYFRTFGGLKAKLQREPTHAEIQLAMGLGDRTFALLLHALNLTRSRVGLVSDSFKEQRNHRKPEKEGRGEKDTFDLIDAQKLDTVADLVSDLRPLPVDEALHIRLLGKRVRDFLSESGVLMDSERFVLNWRFGLNGEEPETLEEVGKRRGVTRERIRQIEANALRKLRNSDLWEHVYGTHGLNDTETAQTESVENNGTPNAVEEVKATETSNVVDLKEVIKQVGSFFGLAEGEILSDTRQTRIAFPRQVLMYVLHEWFKWSFPVIGAALDKDHTTALHAHKKVSEKSTADAKLRKQLEDLRGQLNKSPVTAPRSESSLKAERAQGSKRDVLVEVTEEVGRRYNLTKGEMLLKMRQAQIVLPCQVLMYVLSEYVGWSSERIGEAVGQNPLAVSFACQSVRTKRDSDSSLWMDLKAFQSAIAAMRLPAASNGGAP